MELTDDWLSHDSICDSLISREGKLSFNSINNYKLTTTKLCCLKSPCTLEKDAVCRCETHNILWIYFNKLLKGYVVAKTFFGEYVQSL